MSNTYAISCELVFPEHNGRRRFSLRGISQIKIETSWQSLTDSAEITLARKFGKRNYDDLSKWFREGDPVGIWMGYFAAKKENRGMVLEFTGYVSQVYPGIPLVIRCEDEMYKLKRTNVSVSKANCTLKELLQAIAPGYNIVCDETHLLGSVRFSNMSASQILEELDKNGIKSWFEGKTLHAFGASKSDKPPVKVLLEKTAGESLKQKAIEDTLVTISLLRKIGKKLVVKYGEEGAGRRINRQLSGITMSENEMLSEAKKIYNAAKVPGLDGDVTLFGVPRVQHGMRIDLNSVLYPEKNGVYYIDAVTKTLSENGIRQTCKLGDKSA